MEEQNKTYPFYAFISYKREDEKWAKWLQMKLESYGFPVALRKNNPSLPAKIRPIFRDQSELAGGNLKEEIEKGLQDSKYLIVICSPRAAQSPWVSKEVQYFIDNGREEFIIPFIIGGYPNAANPEDECFPEGLRLLSGEREILGININEMGRDAASIKVIARMFDVRFDTLWQRHERTKRRKRYTLITGVLIFAFIGLVLGGYFVKQNGIIESQNIRLQKDSLAMANHIMRIQKDSFILSHQLDSIDKLNYNMNIALDSIVSIHNTLIDKQAEIVGKYGLDLLNKGEPTKARLLLIEFLNRHSQDLTYNVHIEQTLRQLHFLEYGVGQRLFDRIQIQDYEDFVYNAATRVLYSHCSSFYIDYDCILWEYNTQTHYLKKIFDANKYINDLEGGIEAYSPITNEIFITLPDGNLIKLHIPTGKQSKIVDYKYAELTINPEGTLGIVYPSFPEEDSKFQLIDLTNSQIIEEHKYTESSITFVNNNIIGVEKIGKKTDTTYYKIPGFTRLEKYSPLPKDYILDLDNSNNVLSVYRSSSPQHLYVKDSCYNNTKIESSGYYRYDIGKWIYETEDLKDARKPQYIIKSGDLFSPNKKYLLHISTRGTLSLYDALDRRVIIDFKDFDIMEYDVRSAFWEPNSKYFGLVVKSSKQDCYNIFIFNIQKRSMVLKFESDSFYTSFSIKGNYIIHAGQLLPFLSFSKLVEYYSVL